MGFLDLDDDNGIDDDNCDDFEGLWRNEEEPFVVAAVAVPFDEAAAPVAVVAAAVVVPFVLLTFGVVPEKLLTPFLFTPFMLLRSGDW